MKHSLSLTKYVVVIVMVGFMLGSSLQIAAAAKNAPVRMIPENFSVLAKDVSPAVVHIRVEKTVKGGGAALRHFGNHPFRGPPNPSAAGESL